MTDGVGTTAGVLGGRWRATVTPWGAVDPWDGSPRLDWWIAADDRWHTPQNEAAVRQVALSGTPVVETRVKIPQGDAVQRVYSVADHGGATIIEVHNESALPIAVAFSRRDLRTTLPPTTMAPQGIALPDTATIFPVGHHATVRVALAHDGSVGPLGDTAPSAQVERGWLAQMERASRLVVPVPGLGEALVAQRGELALNGLDDPDEDAVAFLLGAGELVRLGNPPADFTFDVASAVERCARAATGCPWDVDRALIAAGSILAAAGERRAVADVSAARQRLGDRTSRAFARPDGVRSISWIEDQFARPLNDGECVLMPDGFAGELLGGNFETYRLPAGSQHRVSFAVRWHGDRPAVLWEVEGPAGLRLRHAGGAWSSTDASGEALWPAPNAA